MGYDYYPVFAWLKLTGKWSIREPKDPLARRRSYIAIPLGMTGEEAHKRLYHDSEETDLIQQLKKVTRTR